MAFRRMQEKSRGNSLRGNAGALRSPVRLSRRRRPGKRVASDVGSLGGLGPVVGRHVGGAKRLQGLQTITNAFGVFAARLPSLEFRPGSLNEPFAMRDRVRFFAHMAVASFEG